MTKFFATSALAVVLAAASAVPSAYADRGHGHGYRGHAYNGHHHGRGYWRNGHWIALGVLGAAAVGALDDRDCWRNRYGRVVCR
jgi:hypothetical protein